MRFYITLLMLSLLIALPHHAQLGLSYGVRNAYNRLLDQQTGEQIDDFAKFVNIFVVDDNPLVQFSLEYRASDDPNFNFFEEQIQTLADAANDESIANDYDVLFGVENLQASQGGTWFSGSLVSGLQAPGGTAASTEQTLSTVIRIENNTDAEKTFSLISDLILNAEGVGAPDVRIQEFVSSSVRLLKDADSFLAPDEFFADDVTFSGFSAPPIGDLFDEDDLGFPDPPTVFERNASGGSESEFQILPGEVVLMLFTLEYFTSIDNNSEFISQYDGTQSLDFDVTVSGTDLEFEFLPVPEPGSLALLALGAPLVMRRRR